MNKGRSRMILRYCPNSILIVRRVSTSSCERCERYTHEVPRQDSHPCSSGVGELSNQLRVRRPNKILKFRSSGFGSAMQYKLELRCHGGLIATPHPYKPSHNHNHNPIACLAFADHEHTRLSETCAVPPVHE